MVLYYSSGREAPPVHKVELLRVRAACSMSSMVALPPIERFLRLTSKEPDGCWVWLGHCVGSKSWYPRFRPTSRASDPQVYAHRWSYEYFVGSIPAGFEVDHTCFVPTCVNPDHLEAVSPEENQRRKRSRAGIPILSSRKPVCKNGHDLTIDSNCKWDKQGRRRGCKVCGSQRALAQYRASQDMEMV